MNKRDTTGPIDQDVEGHRSYSSSDRTIKDDVEPVAWESEQDTEGHGVRVRFMDADTAEGDDVEGHRFSSSDRTIKDHVEPVSWESAEGEDDTDGHMTRGRG